MNVSVLVNAFTGGELSPLLAARMDTPNYTTGAKRIENAIPMITGGIRKRPGTWYLRNTTGNEPVILIDWLLTDGTSCLVEISEQSNRLQARVISKGLTEGVAVFPAEWTGVDLAKVRHAVGRGLVDPAPGYLPRLVALDATTNTNANTNFIYSWGEMWRAGVLPISLESRAAITFGEDRFVALSGNKALYSKDGEEWTVVTLTVSAQWDAVAYGEGRFLAMGHDPNNDTDTVVIYSDNGGETWTEGNTIANVRINALAWGEGAVVALISNSVTALRSIYKGDSWHEVTIREFPPLAKVNWMALTYYNRRFVAIGKYDLTTAIFLNIVSYSKDDGSSWIEGTVNTTQVNEGPFPVLAAGGNIFLASSGGNGSNAVIYSADRGDTWTEVTEDIPRITSLAYNNGRFIGMLYGEKSDKSVYSEDGGRTWTDRRLPVSGDWYGLTDGSIVQPGSAITTPDYILFTSEDYAKMTALQITIKGGVITAEIFPFNFILGPGQEYPMHVKDIAFYAGRLVLGGLMAADGSPTRIMLSRAPDSLSGKYRYNDFAAGALAGDAIIIDENDMAGSSIEWVFAGRRFLAGTGRASWMDTGEVPTPATFDMGIVEYAGAAFHKPVASKEIIVYVGRDKKRLRAMVWQYSANSGGYADVDIGVVAQHLFSSGIVSYAVMDYPFPTIWIVNGAGELISCTINMQAGISAFARHSLGNLNPTEENPFYAYAESVEVARHKDADRLYVVVKRLVRSVVQNPDGTETIVDTPVRTIEWLELEDLVTADYTESHYVDSGTRVQFDEPESTISGLERLAGQTVAVFADGALEAPKEVSKEGTITLDAPVRKAHVGLPITTRLSLNTAQIPANGTSFGKKRRIEKILLSLYKSIGGTVGTTEKNGEVVITQRFSQEVFDHPVEPFTGNIELFVSGNIDTDGALFITHAEPTPFTALAVVERIAIMEG